MNGIKFEEKEMKQLVCEMCGSTDLIKQDGVFVCQNCGTKYSAVEAEEIMEEDTAEVKSTAKSKYSDYVENLYEMARSAKDEDNPEMAVEFYRRLTIEDPYNWEPVFYYNYFMDIHYDSLGNITDSLGKVFYFIDKSEKNADEKWDIVQEITERIDAICELFVKKQAFKVATLQVKTADLLEKYFADKSLTIVISYLKSSVVNYLELTVDCYILTNEKEVKVIEERIKKMDPEYEAIFPILELLRTLQFHVTIFPEEYSEEFWIAIKYHINNLDSKYASKLKHLTDTAQKEIMQSIKSSRERYGENWVEYKTLVNKELITNTYYNKAWEQIKEYVELGKRLHENNHFQNTNNQEMPKDKQKRNDTPKENNISKKNNTNENKQSKKKVGIIILSVIAIIIAVIVAVNFFGNRIDNNLVGTWRAERDSSISLTFKNNGDMIVRSANAVDDGLTYKIDGDTVIVTFANDDTETYGFAVEGDTLIFGEYYYTKLK